MPYGISVFLWSRFLKMLGVTKFSEKNLIRCFCKNCWQLVYLRIAIRERWGWDEVLATALKVSVFGVMLVRIQSECGKIWTRITPNTNTFYVMSGVRYPLYTAVVKMFCNWKFVASFVLFLQSLLFSLTYTYLEINRKRCTKLGNASTKQF